MKKSHNCKNIFINLTKITKDNLFVFTNSMNVKLPLNDLMCLIQKAESSGNVKEAISLIDTHISELEPYEQNIITNVKEYLQKKLPQTATETSARVQVEMSAQLNNLKKLFL